MKLICLCVIHVLSIRVLSFTDFVFDDARAQRKPKTKKKIKGM